MFKSFLNKIALVGSILLFFVGFVLGILFSKYLFKEKVPLQNILDSQIVIERVAEQGFLVTRTVYTEQKIDITIDKGSDWSNFWWGQQISATALIKSDLGVDLSKINLTDISIDKANKRVCLQLPKANVQSTSIANGVKVSSNNGILHTLLSSDANKDFNLATKQLKSDAMASLLANDSLLEEALQATYPTLQFLFQDFGYEVGGCFSS